MKGKKKRRAAARQSSTGDASRPSSSSSSSASSQTTLSPKGSSSAKASENSLVSSDMLRLACLAGSASLLIATPLLPGEGSAELGVANVLAVGWLVAAGGWLAVFTLDRERSLWSAPVLWSVLGFGFWHLLVLLIHRGSIHMRPGVNMTLVYGGAAACVCTLSQLLRGATERRAWLALLLVVGGGLSSHGLHQYFVSMPRTAREYQESDEIEKQRVLQQFNLDPRKGSADRQHFEDRLTSSEPFATFGLANSLAGFLGPVVVLLVSVIWREFRTRRRTLALASLAAILALCLLCLMLTKSRTAYLATLIGMVLLPLFAGGPGAPSGRRGWLWAGAGVVVVVGLLIVVGVGVGALDIQVVSEALKSFQYRVEYWQATLAMIGDSPLWGCGPGQFQTEYTAYKLPQASETVADPHNFILEVASTVGLPGLLLLIVIAALTIRGAMKGAVASAQVGSPFDADAPTVLDEDHNAQAAAVKNSSFQGPRLAINLGAALGLAIALAAGAMVNHIPDRWALAALLFAFVLGAPLMWSDIQTPRSGVAAAICVWCVNLLAAGGFGFPGVAIMGWVLLAAIIASSPAQSWRPHQGIRLALLVGLAACVLAGMQFGTKPLQARFALTSPLLSNSFSDSQRLGLEAAERDPLWVEPWSHLAGAYYQRWMRTGQAKHRRAFDDAMQMTLELDPQTWSRRRQVGFWRLSAWRARGAQADLDAAVAAFEEAVERFPNSIQAHAQLAWALHLKGDSRASQAAARALELDALNPHQEHKLNRQTIFDPGPSSFVTGQPAVPSVLGAEPLMQQLRNNASE